MDSGHITGIIAATAVLILVALLVTARVLTDSERFCASAGGGWTKNREGGFTCTLHPVEGK